MSLTEAEEIVTIDIVTDDNSAQKTQYVHGNKFTLNFRLEAPNRNINNEGHANGYLTCISNGPRTIGYVTVSKPFKNETSIPLLDRFSAEQYTTQKQNSKIKSITIKFNKVRDSMGTDTVGPQKATIYTFSNCFVTSYEHMNGNETTRMETFTFRFDSLRVKSAGETAGGGGEAGDAVITGQEIKFKSWPL